LFWLVLFFLFLECLRGLARRSIGGFVRGVVEEEDGVVFVESCGGILRVSVLSVAVWWVGFCDAGRALGGVFITGWALGRGLV